MRGTFHPQGPHGMANAWRCMGQPLLRAHALQGHFVGLLKQGLGLLGRDHVGQGGGCLRKIGCWAAKAGQQTPGVAVVHAVGQAQTQSSAQFVVFHGCLPK